MEGKKAEIIPCGGLTSNCTYLSLILVALTSYLRRRWISDWIIPSNRIGWDAHPWVGSMRLLKIRQVSPDYPNIPENIWNRPHLSPDYPVWSSREIFYMRGGSREIDCILEEQLGDTVSLTSVGTPPPPVTGFFYWTRSSHRLLAYEQWVDIVFLPMYRQLVTGNKIQVKYLQWRMGRNGRAKKEWKRGKRDKRGCGRKGER